MNAKEGKECIALAREGDPGAREQLYRHFEGPLRAYLNRKTGTKLTRAVSLSDLAQETFVQALGALRVLPPEATLDDFRGILFRHALWLLGKQAEKYRDFRGESGAPDPGQAAYTPAAERSQGEVTRLDEMKWLEQLVARLDAEHAEVIKHRLAGRTFAEIATALSIREGTARQRYLRGSRELRRLTEER